MNAKAVSECDLIIVGASTRAAAFSALRAGLRPYCLDAFGDADLAARVPGQVIPDYPDGLIPILKTMPRLPVVYTGGIENRADILDYLDENFELWGNRKDAVARVRDAAVLADAARLARVGFPEWRASSDPPPMDGTWLLKPIQSAGGSGICVWNEAAANSPTLAAQHLFQKFIDGVPFSAVFVAPAPVCDVRFVGMTQQIIGEKACHAQPFQWCGNIGPISLTISLETNIRRFGNILKWKLGMLGVFGVDLILDANGDAWVTEVNPRYPASFELLEHATGLPLFLEHCRCFTEAEFPDAEWNEAINADFVGKAVYYSPTPFTSNTELAEPGSVQVFRFPEIADLPAPGYENQAGSPVCTVFESGSGVEETWFALQHRLLALDAQFRHSSDSL
ncbi:ATP-grasp domain-containing protein [Planctomicrobium sp. SH668]|uniref:ATP-grasp domain-containing protein n=1 Tax=Planctomicrobium sp. SH668 TaxID=3448126 RepID=UPI003F5CAF85